MYSYSFWLICTIWTELTESALILQAIQTDVMAILYKSAEGNNDRQEHKQQKTWGENGEVGPQPLTLM